MGTHGRGKEKEVGLFSMVSYLRSNCAYRSVLLSRQRSHCPLPLPPIGRGRVVRRGSARCTQCLRASRSTSLYPAAWCSRGAYYHCKSSLVPEVVARAINKVNGPVGRDCDSFVHYAASCCAVIAVLGSDTGRS